MIPVGLRAYILVIYELPEGSSGSSTMDIFSVRFAWSAWPGTMLNQLSCDYFNFDAGLMASPSDVSASSTELIL